MPFVGHHLIGPPRVGPIVSIWHSDLFRLSHIHFATEDAGWTKGVDFFYMFEEKSSHPKKPKENLQRLAIGEKITVSEWVRRKPKLPNGRRLPVCLMRAGELRCLATFLVPAKLRGESRTFSVTPILNGSDSSIKVIKQEENLPDRQSRFFSIKFAFKERLPNVVGKHSLKLIWRIDGHRFRVFNGSKWKVTETVETDHVIYTIFGPPLKPGAKNIGNAKLNPDDGTWTGTQRRFDILMAAFGPTKQHAASSKQDRIDLRWQLHKSINNNKPPHFHGRNVELITVDAFPDFEPQKVPRNDWPMEKMMLPQDQWLMWVGTKKEEKPIDPKDKKEKKPRPRYWNDASCSGHAQLQKTMMASIGMFGEIALVFPHTTQAPITGDNPTKEKNHGEQLTFAEGELFSTFEEYLNDNTNKQEWIFQAKLLDEFRKPVFNADGKRKKKILTAEVVLMNGNAITHEYFEGCLLTVDGRFLTGGFPTANVKVKNFHANKGFLKATDLLTWWTSLREAGGRRFLSWMATDDETDRNYYFDRFGYQHDYPATIRKMNLDLKWEP